MRLARQLVNVQQLGDDKLEHELERLVKFKLRHTSDMLPEIFVERGYEALFARVAYLQDLPFAAGDAGGQAEFIARYARDVAQIYKAVVVAPHEPVGGAQLLLQFFKSAARLMTAPPRMINQVMADDLDVPYVFGGKIFQLALVVQTQFDLAVEIHVPEHVFELHGEVVVADGLDHEIGGVDLVALDGELRHVGDEDERHGIVHVAQLAGGLHAVDVGQHNVEQHDVEILVVDRQKIQPVVVPHELIGYIFLPAIALKVRAYDFLCLGFVLYDGDA